MALNCFLELDDTSAPLERTADTTVGELIDTVVDVTESVVDCTTYVFYLDKYLLKVC